MLLKIVSYLHRYTKSATIHLIVLIIVTLNLEAQICNGNLGQNIFTNGDFGSGTSNVLQTNPQIAPGYIYETNPPPQDGKYTITNSTGVWNLFDGWISTYDNSPDPYGYMMVVNASYEPGLFYSQAIEGLCENTVYEFSADIINLIGPGWNMIKPDVSFLLNGVEMYSTGDIPENRTWETYGFTFETHSGQTSINLSLRNNAPGGMGNDLAIDNISFRPCGPEAIISPNENTIICENGDPVEMVAELLDNTYPSPVFQWQYSDDNGQTWTNIPGATSNNFTHSDNSPGSYYYRYLVANGNVNLDNYKCRIASTEKIITVIPKYTNFTDTICNGLGKDFAGSTYYTTGIYYDSLLNFLGCDSIIVLNLYVTPDEPMYSIANIHNPPCEDGVTAFFQIDTIYNGKDPFNFVFDGTNYNINHRIENLPPGDYYYSITDRYGCYYEDSATIYPSGSFTIDLGNDITVELGESIHLVPESSIEIDNYLWSPEGVNNCEVNCTELEFTPTESVYVFAQATSDLNCTKYDSVFIDVIKTRKLYIPNAFTPNNDGLNDVFMVVGSAPNVQNIEQLQIFDRWGKLIFIKEDFPPDDIDSGWDGSYEGNILKTGTFIYSIDVVFFDNAIINYSGTVTIIR